MSAALSLYRRHRPQSFDEVVGQEHVVRTLRNAVEQDRVHHAYLFVGSRGTGKTSMAKILARSLNCVNGPTSTPCGKCEACREIAASTSLDVIEMDAASNRSVDDIRELRERVGYLPAAGRWKVYILDEAHMLTKEAWNAFLKTLEEPPPNTVFVLATTEAHKVMGTIVDRCQRFDFQRPSAEQIAEVLGRVSAAEGIEIEDPAVSMIARAATGSFRDALGILDQLVAYGGERVTLDTVLETLGIADADLLFQAADAIGDGDGRAALTSLDGLVRSGREVPQFGRDLVAHLRQLLVIRATGEVPSSFTVAASEPEKLRTQADAIEDATLVRAIDELSAALAAIKEGDDPRMSLEVALLRSARPDLDPSQEALLDRVARLEGGRAPAAGSETSEERGRVAGSGSSEEEPSASEATTSTAPRDGDPPPPTPPAEPTEDDPIDLERLQRVWPAVVDRMREGSPVLSALFDGARPLEVDGSTIRVGFPAGATFNKKKAEELDNREQLSDALRAVTGRPLRAVYLLLDGEGEADTGEELTEDELIERIKAEFDAEEYGEAT